MPIPAPERLIGSLLIRRWCRQHPPSATIPLAREQHAQLAALIAASPDAARRVQIRRLPGLEASSTNYSLAMVADHLARVNTAIATTLTHLARNEPDPTPVVIAAFKPSPEADPATALAANAIATEHLAEALADLPAIERSTQPHTHPWFGPLPANTWACFPTFHNAIHLKQAALIANA